MTEREQRAAARKFAEFWKDRGYERGESQIFWISLLQNVLDVDNPEELIVFESQVKLDHTKFIDARIPRTQTLIEQKSADVNLRQRLNHGGTFLTPYEQAQRYVSGLPRSQHPRWIVTCNFQEFLVYDMEKPNAEPESILLKNLPREYHRLQFLIDAGNENIKREMEISQKAGDLVGILYDEILQQYVDRSNPETLKNLNILCVRLVFCLYAEDAGIFGRHLAFHDYIRSTPLRYVPQALKDLFKVLATKEEDRSPYLDEQLKAFPYVNGGLFEKDDIMIPSFNDRIINLLLREASEGFDWSEISPTIFGAMFESTMNPETRRNGGMHYTSIENIHKVIDPLFLDDLKAEFAGIKEIKVERTRNARLETFRNQLSSLKFLDPACGSGNFLTETYLSLRKLENEALALQLGGQMTFETGGIIKVSIEQFYGIEINDFAVTVAKTALWIAESQMMKETADLVNQNLDFLPLKSYANIVEANALRIDWESVVPKDKLSYIMGNPPFVGARKMTAEQKADTEFIFNSWNKNGDLDYVACWYKKTKDYIVDTNIRTALVSTNSITQGEQVAILWKSLFDTGVHIDFAYQTFRWDSEANIKAHVHCVIIGFSVAPSTKCKLIYSSSGHKEVTNINAYLIDGANVFIEERKQPICKVSQIRFGSMPNDGKKLYGKGAISNFTEEEKNDIVREFPQAEICFKRFYGADEFINNTVRWCLWLKDISPVIIKSIPPIKQAVENVRAARLKSSRKETKKLADNPKLFGEIRQPENGYYLLVPRHSSEKYRYIPMGYLSADNICGDANLLIPEATLYEFGILTSNIHNWWMHIVGGRIKSDYRYSTDVYNNFPWCEPTVEQKAMIEETAKAILAARAKYPDCTLADLYGEEMYLFPELLQAHRANDQAVMEAYGFSTKMTELECVAELMKLYKSLTDK